MRSPSARHNPFWLGCFLLAIITGTAWAAPSGEITGTEVDAKQNRILIPYKGTLGAHRAHVIGSPNRLVIDFRDTLLGPGAPPKINGGAAGIHEIRLGNFKGQSRVVVDFQNSTVPSYKISRNKDRVEVRFATSVAQAQEATSASSNAENSQSVSPSPLSPEVMPAAANPPAADVKSAPTRWGSQLKPTPLRLAQAGAPTLGSGSSQVPSEGKTPASAKPGAGKEKKKTSPAGDGKVAQAKELTRPEAPSPMRREPSSPPAPPAPSAPSAPETVAPGIPTESTSSGRTVISGGPRMVREVRPPVTPPTPDPRLTVQEITELKFIQVGHNSRLVVKGGDHLDYRVNKISPTKVRLDLVNAEIPKVHQKPLRTDLFSTSVEMIVPGSQTIFVQLKDAVPYQVQKQKGVLMIDFPPPRFALTNDQKAVLKEGVPADTAGMAEREKVRERLLEKRGAARAMQEEEARRQIESLESEVQLLDKGYEDLLKERREIARQYKVTPDPEVFRKPVTMDFQGITLKNAFRLLGEQAGINIIVDDNVKGNATVKLREVPLGQVIDNLLDTNNLDRDLIGNVMWIADKKRIEENIKKRRDEQKRLRDDVEARIKKNRDDKRDLERRREKAADQVAKAEAAVEEAAEESPAVETVGSTEVIEIEGEPVTLLLVQIKLSYEKPSDVQKILDCVFNRNCVGIKIAEEQRLTEREAVKEAIVDQGFLPGSPGYADRMREYTREEDRQRGLAIAARRPAPTAPTTEAGPTTWSEMDPKFKKLLAHTMIWPSDKEKLLFIRDIPERIEEMKKLIATLDIPTPQVLIESRVVQATREWARGLGIQWGGANNQSYVVRGDRQAIWGYAGQAGAAFTPTSGAPTAPPIGTPITSGFAVNFPTAAAANLINAAMGLQFGLVAGQYATDLALQLQLGEASNNIKIIARPKVQVVDRLKARIKQGTQIPYPTTSANTGTQVQLVNADLLLEVTPTIYPDGRILMKLKVTDNAPGASFNGFTSITTREAETNMIVRDGDTAVIGGILRKNYTRLRQGWPGLMNVPLVNLLFGNNTVEDVVRELLVFVTPTIVKRPPPAS